MKFDPQTKAEIEKLRAERMMFPAGRYPFQVAEAEEGIGKTSRKPYIKLKLIVYVGDQERTLYDYLTEAMPEKLHSFCEATGLSDVYREGELEAEHCEGRQAYVYVAQGKAKGDFPAKNEAREYFAREADQAIDIIDDDSVPF